MCRPKRSGYSAAAVPPTLALRAGVTVEVISKRLGHESPAFTLKPYARVVPGYAGPRPRMPVSRP